MRQVTACHNRQEKLPVLHANHRKMRYVARKHTQYPIRAQPAGPDQKMHMVCEGSGQVAWQTTEPDKTVLPPPPADCQTMTAYFALRKATAFRLLDRLLLAMYDEERLRNASLSQLTSTFHEVIRTFSALETNESKQNGMLEKLLAELKEIE